MPHKNIEQRRKYHRDYKERVGKEVIKRKHRAWRLPKIYGISLDQYESLLEAQEDKCALCKRHQTEFRKGYNLAVDHCHETGKVRGLVCYPCNTILSKGLDFFERGVEYLNSSPVGRDGETIIRVPDVPEITHVRF